MKTTHILIIRWVIYVFNNSTSTALLASCNRHNKKIKYIKVKKSIKGISYSSSVKYFTIAAMNNVQAKTKQNARTNTNHNQGGDVVHNFKWLYYLTRLSGLNGFRLPNDPNESVRLTPLIFVQCALFTVIFSGIGVINSIENFRFNFSRSIFVNLGFRTLISCSSIHVVMTLTSDLINRHQIWEILTECNRFDQQVTKV